MKVKWQRCHASRVLQTELTHTLDLPPFILQDAGEKEVKKKMTASKGKAIGKCGRGKYIAVWSSAHHMLGMENMHN